MGLLQRYFQKVNGYRSLSAPYHNIIPKRMTTGVFFNDVGLPDDNKSLIRQSRRVSNGLFGTDPLTQNYGDIFTNNVPSLWSVMGSHGAPDAIRHDDPIGRTSTGQLALNFRRAKSHFLILSGSWFGDWNGNNGQNNFLKAVLGMNTYGLSVQWTRVGATSWDTLSLGSGDSSAHVMLRTIQRNLLIPNHSVRTTFILGDPSLRTLWSSPVLNVRKDASYTGTGRQILWDPPSIQFGSNPSYHVFRGNPGSLAYSSFVYVGSTTSTSIVDASATGTPNTYWIRRESTVPTGSGSFVDFGQAGWADIN